MKKVLSFVLVLAMILGSVSMAFAFTDDTTITNKEAAAVLNAAGVIEGYTDGSFKATGILTRAEGAAIAARLVLGKTEAAKLTTVVAPFNDVPATHWAAGYISYCVSQGYLNGYGNGNFGPEDTLTVAQFGKMMLTLLGYKSENEGFVGDAWETNVGSVMVKAGLTDGVTLSGSNSCSREVAAQVALNTLKGELVKYEGTPTTVSAGNVTVTTGQSAAKKDDWATGDKENYKNEVRTAGLANSGNVRFMNRYQKDLKLGATLADDFGRPDTNKWTYKNNDVYTAKSSSNLVATYTNKQTQKTLYNLLDGLNALDATIEYDVNGVATTNAAVKNILSKSSTANFPVDRTGLQIEVYYDSSNGANGHVTIVAYEYFLVKADADYSTKDKAVKVTMKSAGAGAPALAGDNKKIESKDFAVENVKEDDYLIITYAKGKFKSVAPATEVTGTVDTYTDNDNITLDGTKYTQSAEVSADKITGLSVGTGATLVLDPNNLVMEVTDKTSSKNYMYIYAREDKGSLGTHDYKARVYFADGSTQVVEFSDETTFNNATPGAWVNYSVKADGKYKISRIDGRNTAGTWVTSGAVKYDGVNTANSETVFIVKKSDKTSASVYTGYKAVPTVNAVATVAGVKKSATDATAKYVFVEAASGDIHSASTSDYLLIYKSGTGYKSVYGADDYFTYDKTILNGGAAGVTEFANDTAIAISPAGLWKEVSYDSDGRVEKAVLVAPGDSANGFDVLAYINASTAAVKYAGNVITWKDNTTATVSYSVDADAPVFVIEGSDVTEVKASNVEKNLDETKAYTPFIVFKTGETDPKKLEIKTIYFVQLGN